MSGSSDLRLPARSLTVGLRAVPARARLLLEQAGIHPLLARLFAARGIANPSDLPDNLSALLPPATLLHTDHAAQALADAIAQGQRLTIVADYDCDGATACAVALRGLRAMGAQVEFVVPDRFKLGYGLTPGVVDLAITTTRPDWIVTVDNGIASVEGVAHANAQGVQVLVTDHHLPADTLPAAAVIVNPNQPGCSFASKNLAGVGVLFYVLLALRALLRKRGHFGEASGPNLAALLDLVALGTVADVVKLDANNRLLVSEGLERIRQGKMQPGLAALFRASGRDPTQASPFDLGFALGPRINAAGRLGDMSIGIRCLTEDDPSRALQLAQQLDTMNRERKAIEGDMRERAFALVDALDSTNRYTHCLLDQQFHQGIVGIVAARVRERTHRATIVFAPDESPGLLKGSGRSIAALHLRDCLDLVTKRFPHLIKKFGGHAMAAGLTIENTHLEAFSEAFEAAAQHFLQPQDLADQLLTDGSLEPAYCTLQVAQLLDAQVWGQGFAAPLFMDHFEVVSQRLLKEAHTKLALKRDGKTFDAICFNNSAVAPARVRAAYRLQADEFNGMTKLSLVVEHWESV
jgi:single-stranded-DNA-specific exonuclease